MRLPAVAFVGTMALLALGAPLAAGAGSARVGLLGPSEEPRFSEIGRGLRHGLRDHGFADDAIEILEARVRRRDAAAARSAVEEFLRRRTSVAFVIGSSLARLAREAAPELPIVFVTPGDPVAAGLVRSLAHPGGHMTAMTFEYPELSGKRLELLKELLPTVRRVLVLYDPRDASPRQGVAAARDAASRLGIVLVEREARAPAEIPRALEALDDVDALLGVPGGFTSGYQDAMIRAAHAKGRPTMFHARTASTGDALVTYGTSDTDVAREAARLVAKILRGAKAGELPVERPTRITLVLNLRTARALGLTIPRALLLRADQVIE